MGPSEAFNGVVWKGWGRLKASSGKQGTRMSPQWMGEVEGNLREAGDMHEPTQKV